MSTQDDSSEAPCILSALEIDLVPSSCPDVPRALLHVFRSRQRPVPVVQALLGDLTMEHIQKTHEKLLQDDYLVRNDDDSSLLVMKRVAATVWFLQLLLECPSVLTNNEQQVHQMALKLLQHFIKTIQTLLQQQQTIEEEQDEVETISTTSLNARTVASFSVGALLKVVNPYVSTLPILLSPLWKGICTLSSLHSLPPEVANETLGALCQYLQEGTIQTMQAMNHYMETKTVVPQLALQLKIVTFLVARCAVLLQNYPPDKSTKHAAVPQVKSLLFELRGLTHATRASLTNTYSRITTQDETFLSQLASLQHKVETCLVDSFQSTNYHFDLKVLLRLQFKTSKIKIKEVIPLASSSFYVGKALVLNRLLRDTAVQDVSSRADETTTTTTLSPQTAQSLVWMIQELLFSTLPSCGGISDLLSSSLFYMVSATSRLHFYATVETRSQFHRLLVSWLAPSTEKKQLHPMTREVLISLVHLHVVSVAQQDAGEEVATSDSPRSVDTYNDESDTHSLAGIQPLLSLLVKVLVDSRTRTVHRRNVASVLIRLLNGTTTNDSSLVCRNTSLVLQQTIAVEVHQVMKVDVKAQRRKRKRTKTTSDNNENTSCHCRPLGSFAADDVQVIAQVLKQVSVYTLPSLDSVLSGLARDIVANNKDSSSSSRPKNGNYRIGKYSRNAVSLQLALASGIMAKSSTLESFKNKTGMQVGDFLSSIITWLAGQRRGGEAMRIRTLQAVAIVACLDFVATSVPHVATMPLDQLRILVDLIQDYSRVSRQVLQLDSPPRSADERQSAVSILFSVAALLAGTTRVIPTSCPADILQGIAFTYQMLFQTNAWPIMARTVTSLVQFASTIPSAHQGILPECIPTGAQGLLQCRLQGLVYRKADSHKESESIAANENCSKSLIPVLKRNDSLFVTTSNNDDHIREGSYVLTMPTEDGRSATVIFAPGEESLSDIKYMLGKEDFDNVQVRQLEQVRLIGNGCRFLSKTLEL